MTNQVGSNAKLLSFIATVILAVSLPSAQAQVLEEVVVTAQRRVQSLQDVPVSVEVFSGAEIDLMGYRNMDDLSKFSPSVNIENGIQTQEVTIRGFGTTGNSLLLMSATPIFVDGIHFGRPSMIKNAFMDTERVEVLKGPQPLHFGMDATAGAFNIQTRRPGPEWEGELSAEYGNNNRSEVSGGFGGPVTDTLGVRVFGALEKIDGFAKNRVDPGQKISGYNNVAGRIVSVWTPNQSFNILGKLDYSRQKSGGELYMGCLTEGNVSGYTDGRRGPVNSKQTDDAFIGILGGGEAVWALPEDGGIPFSDPIVRPDRVTSKGMDCFQGDYGFSREGPYLPPPLNITGEGVRRLTDGTIDHRALANEYLSKDGANGPGRDGTNTGGIRGRDHIESWNVLLDMNYALDNGININSQTAYVEYFRNNVRDQSYDPFFSNFQGRQEDVYQWSQQIRVDSPLTGYDINLGDVETNVEFMLGAFWQKQEMDAYASLFKDATGQGYRMNDMWEDPTWTAAFWNMTFNFMDRQFSFSAGGRYGHVKTQGFIRSTGAELIWDTVPCDSDGTDSNPDTCAIDPHFKMVHPDLTTYTIIDPVTGRGDAPPRRHVRVDSPAFLLDTADRDNLWTAARYRDNNALAVPLNWRGPFNGPVGITAPLTSVVNGPFGNCDFCEGDLYETASNYDSQFVISYTPDALNRDHTFYGKYASAFKGPIYDGSLGNIAPTAEQAIFFPEYVKAWEVGGKGRLMNNRMRYDVALFTNKFKDLQTNVAAPLSSERTSSALNAGEQKVDGGEFNLVYALTQNWTVNLAGAVMQGKMGDFDGGGCSTQEMIAAAIDAVENPGARSAEELDFADEILDSLGDIRRANLPARSEIPEEFFINGGCRLEAEGERPAETIDRSGDIPARTPDFKFVLGVDYSRPVMNNYMVSLGLRGVYQDDTLTDGESYTRHIQYHAGGDISMLASFGPLDGTWSISGYARNLLEYTKSYDPAYDLEKSGLTTSQVPASAFTAYGIKVNYNFR